MSSVVNWIVGKSALDLEEFTQDLELKMYRHSLILLKKLVKSTAN